MRIHTAVPYGENPKDDWGENPKDDAMINYKYVLRYRVQPPSYIDVTNWTATTLDPEENVIIPANFQDESLDFLVFLVMN